MINDGDTIAVGLSGGKDSVTLLYILNQIRAFYHIQFNIKAITLDPCFYNNFTDYSNIVRLCKSLNVEYTIERYPLWEIIFEIRKEKNPCSLCSRMRHGILHKICKEQNCNKIALGHNSDDVIETFFMNLFYGGRISAFSPKSYLSRKDLYMIRPLIFCDENEIRKFVSGHCLPICKSSCPKDNNSSRECTKTLIKNLENSYPKLKKKLFHAIETSHISEW